MTRPLLSEVARLRVEAVTQAMPGMQRASWEQGVAAQALLEWDRACELDITKDIALYSLCHDAAVRQDSDGRLAVRINGGDSGVLDPASLVEPLLSLSKALSEPAFEAAARRQIGYLMNGDTPRMADGTLSHRTDKVQLWVDGIYMGPPALAFAGAYWNDTSLTNEALKQLRSYHEILFRPEHQLYGHVWDSTSNDRERKALWGVGNGWALAGMVRVLELVSNEAETETATLPGHYANILAWIKLCLDGVLAYKREDHLFHYVLDHPSTFVDANVAQQVAYTIFRLAGKSLISQNYVGIAEDIRKTVHARVDAFGFVRGVCGSPTFDRSGTATEAQAFFILMEAAYHDFTKSRMEYGGF